MWEVKTRLKEVVKGTNIAVEKQIKKWIRKARKKSDSQEAGELISFYYREIYAYVYKQTINKELAIDLTQEIFLNMLESIHHYDENKAAFRTWLYKIATYRLVAYYRSKFYKYERLSEELEEDVTEVEDFAFSIENRLELERINDFISRLESINQQVFRMKIFGEYSFLEISNSLKIPESTAKSKFYTVLKQVRKHFERSDVHD